MIYTLILKPKFKNILRVFVFIMLIVFSASLYSCQTYYTENYTPEKLNPNEDVTILEVTTKKDSIINLSDYDVMYKENYKDSLDILWFETPDTNFIKAEKHKEFNSGKIISVINLKDISQLKVEKSNFSIGKTLMYAGFTALGIIVIVIIGLFLFPPKVNTGGF